MRFRIGINVDVMVKEGDIFGNGVNVAAHLEGLVSGGESAFPAGFTTTCVIAAGWFSKISASNW